MSKHVDGHNCDQWDNSEFRYTYKSNYSLLVRAALNVAMTKYCTELKVQMLQISYNIDVAILVALI